MMSLTHKIILLVSFMSIVTFITFLWFVSRLLHHGVHFKASVTQEREMLEANFERSLKKLNTKAEQLGEETNDHLHKMEEKLLKNRQEAAAFYEDFLQRQNQHFDNVNNFLSNTERKP